MYSFQHGLAFKGLNFITVGFCDQDFMKSFTFMLKSNVTPVMLFKV